MTVVITFENVTPISRGDGNAWTDARIEEATTAAGSYTAIETIDLSTLPGGLDSDPLNPATRTLTTEEGTADGLWYRIVFIDADGDESAATDPIQNTSAGTAYGEVNELLRRLKVRNITDDHRNAAADMLAAATLEINSEIDRADDADDLTAGQLSLIREVCYERAAEYWQESPFGLVVLDSQIGTVGRTARDTWDRYAHKLAPIKGQWGFS